MTLKTLYVAFGLLGGLALLLIVIGFVYNFREDMREIMKAFDGETDEPP